MDSPDVDRHQSVELPATQHGVQQAVVVEQATKAAQDGRSCPEVDDVVEQLPVEEVELPVQTAVATSADALSTVR